MNAMSDWVAAHALPVWSGLLVLALLSGDLAWQWNRRHYDAAIARGHTPVVLRSRTAAWLLVSGCFLFMAIALAIGEQTRSWLSGFDVGLAEDLRAHMQPGVLSVVAMASHLGDLATVAAISAAVLGILIWRRHLRAATVWTIAVAGIVPLNSALKAWFQRPRPLYDHGFIVEHGWSFPSGHAFGAMVFYGMLAYVLLRLTPRRWHRWVIALAVAMVTIIGLSRIVLQVHYFSDVMAGYISGAVWLLLCIAGAEWWRSRSVDD
ncbi:phosphatase PAP2 family protein [Dyella sp. ASV21]|uniref:phosphatase PAP2 family protein n=1 Tax=Dyella sp. ASV21 TaxID=2795114 RepID=UPI0018ECD28B|nr:phosphatase PAP2 family protein [Dyella sp. ASV21]